MDEQTTTAATEAQEPVTETQEPVTATEPAEEMDAGLPEGSDIGIDADGEVRFGDSFFDGFDGMAKRETETPQAEAPKEPAAPAFYDVEELGRTALADVDVNRLDPAKIRDYWGMVQRVMVSDRERIAGLEAQIAQMRAAQTTPQPQTEQKPQPQPPAGMSRKEMTQAAVNRAREILGLPEDEDLDLYEAEHQMAFAQAAQEVSQRQQQMARAAAEQAEMDRFVKELKGRSDFGEFSRWFDRSLAANGRTPEQVNAGIAELVQQHGPGIVKQLVGRWYQQFREEIGRQAAAGVPKRTAQRPPVLEGAGGGSPAGRKVVDLKAFSAMNSDEQEKALIDMGLV